ncbi:MAG: fenitrothion hydrolase [Solirubrobacterales bacterium]|nr:fenitrothion hydrolase [Solirubrobacterales bacterium]
MNLTAIPLAHGLGFRSDLPLPSWLFAWGAALMLALSLFAFAALWNDPKLEMARLRELFRVPQLIEPVSGALGIAIFALLVYFGFFGNQDPDQNVLPTIVYVFFWTMLPLVSAIFGDVFKPFNPWRATARYVAWLRARRTPGHRHIPPRFAYPDRLGRWPAVIAIVAFGWLSQAGGDQGREPSTLAMLALVYAAFQFLGMSLFGAERWADRGDAFALYFDFFGRISPLTIDKGRLCARLPLSGLTDIAPLIGTVAFVSAMIGITVFDGAERAGLWQSIVGDDPSKIVEMLGLVACVAFVAGFYRLGVVGMKLSHIEKSSRELGLMFAPSLVPIALGYLLAHYLSFMLFVGQALPHVIAHPMGNSGSPQVAYFVSGNVIWGVQVLALLAGHIAGLIVAHDEATAVWGKARAAARSQMWMLVVMVGFAGLGLWLLSQSPS